MLNTMENLTSHLGLDEPYRSPSSRFHRSCAEEHPPLLASGDAVARDRWSLVEREGKLRQWAYQGRPLYLYKYDDSPGDPYGADVASVWSQAMVSGELFTPRLIARKSTLPVVQAMSAGPVFADHRGLTLYTFDRTKDGSGGGSPESRDSKQWQPLRAGSVALPIGD
jgi:predicted lipoprotein with Yx(FWY)xxD motif